jgi:hypothetical protein
MTSAALNPIQVPLSHGNTPQQIRTNTRQLLIACARTTVNTEVQDAIHAYIDAGIDWEFFFQQTGRHMVMPIVLQTLQRTAPDRVPAPILSALQGYVRSTAFQNLITFKYLIDILKLLNAAGIHAMPYKGHTLATIAYGGMHLRQFSDLDILVAPAYKQAAKAVLLAQGFEEDADLDYECSFIHRRLGVAIDLHIHLFPPFLSYPETLATLTPRLHPLHVEDYTLNTLNPEDLFLLLVLQLGKDCCNRRLRLGQICDMSELLHRHPQINWIVILQRAQSMGAMRLLGLALHLLTNWFAIDVPPAVAQQCKLRSDVLETLLTGLYAKLWDSNGAPEFENPTFMDFLQTQDHRFYLQIRERRIDRYRYILWWVMAVITTALSPTDGDRQIITLPPHLQLLYFPIHWGRMLIKYPKLLLKKLWR